MTSQVIGASQICLGADKVPTKLDRLSMCVNVYHHIPSLKWLFNIYIYTHTITHMVIRVYIKVISLFLDRDTPILEKKKSWEPFNNHRQIADMTNPLVLHSRGRGRSDLAFVQYNCILLLIQV